jgi:uroporphyrinogen decarboxylase
MPKETMSPKERWLAVLKRKKPDRLPMDYWATPETTILLMKHLGCSSEEETMKRLHVDRVVKVKPKYVGPSPRPGYDVFGCKYKQVDYGTGTYKECIFHPLAEYESVSDVERLYRWPDPDWWDYSSVKAQIKGKEMYPVLGGEYEPFLIYKDLRGQEKALRDLIEFPELVHFCLDRLFNLGFRQIGRIYEQIPGKVMLTYVAEDMGAQEDLMMSPALIRKFLLPRMKRMVEFVHQNGAFAFHHNDGSIRRILPDMIKIGIDILNPIQWRCKNMDRKELKKEFGHKVIFHGAMDNQYTLPFGSVSEVRSEVIENLEVLGMDGGYILAPCHNIQSITPAENILAMYETGYTYGWT